MMKALVCKEPGTLVLEEKPLPEDAPEGWALVNIDHIGLCGTDFHIFHGLHPYLEYPRIMGHELSGTLVAASGSFSKGERVIINPYLACGECDACKAGKPNCCYHINVLGVHRDGGMCERLAVPEKNLYPAGDLPAHHAAMVEFLAIGAHAVRRGRVEPGMKALVVGVGPIGLGTALFARQSGADVHLLDFSKARLGMVGEQFAFNSTFDATSSRDDILGVTGGGGFDIVLDATGNKTAIENGFQYVGHGGTYVLVSVVQGEVRFEDPEFHKREMSLVGSRNATKKDFDRVIETLKSGVIDGDKLNSHQISMEALPAQIRDWAKDREGMIKAIIKV